MIQSTYRRVGHCLLIHRLDEILSLQECGGTELLQVNCSNPDGDAENGGRIRELQASRLLRTRLETPLTTPRTLLIIPCNRWISHTD